MAREEGERKAAAKKAAEDAEDSDSDEKVFKARAWDDWKDDNPRGAGNSKLRPCA